MRCQHVLIHHDYYRMGDLIQRTIGPEIALETVCAAALWNTLVDQSQLENALLNLCINARDAMPGGGKLTLETANRWLDERAARGRDIAPGQYVSLCVSDSGTGMSPEVMSKEFDPFFTTKPMGSGTGLGLSMIYGFARQSGGEIRMYSELEKGTMMCVYLPRYLGAAEIPEATYGSLDAARAGQNETVLVVDDEPTVRMLVVDVLQEAGYTAIDAADGNAGLKLLNSKLRVDLLVSDVGLPGGMNGRQLADAARQNRPDLKVLFITGYAENAVLNHGHLDHGMHVLTKPFTMETLARRIKSLRRNVVDRIDGHLTGRSRNMATGWAGDGAVQDQIDATVKDAISRVQSQLPQGPSLTHCEACEVEIPEARRAAVHGVRLCVSCQAEQDRETAQFSGYNRRGSKDSQLR